MSCIGISPGKGVVMFSSVGMQLKNYVQGLAQAAGIT
jgi:hypothetical protein